MRRFVGVVAAVLLVLPAVRSEAQKRIGVEVYFLKVQPDASARYGLEKLSQPLEDRSLHQKFFNDLPDDQRVGRRTGGLILSDQSDKVKPAIHLEIRSLKSGHAGRTGQVLTQVSRRAVHR